MTVEVVVEAIVEFSAHVQAKCQHDELTQKRDEGWKLPPGDQIEHDAGKDTGSATDAQLITDDESADIILDDVVLNEVAG